ncbi:protein MOR1-like isoform X2 [Rhododendron vialii]|uniref:protein MOR1-like isoform X2 n=1 Tax=Rhododendron vialii TaxID=182163 RepID=UPI00265DC3B3|nr:protein MOR1-like isoform X2 [Rhododendron vialii]
MSEDEKLLKEAKKLPWEDRLTHKCWKVRNEANTDLASVCESIADPKDPCLRAFGPFFKKTIADSNASVQDKALDALIAYLKATDADAGRYAKEVCDAIVGKCLMGRPKTVEKSQMVLMLWVEVEAVDAFLDGMEKAIKNKVAKAVVPAIDVMFQALSEFGAKIVPPKRILKMLPELFDHQDQHVRASSKGLTLELCRWIGKEPVKSILFEKMRDTMKKELEAELVNVTTTARPSRKIRSEQDKEPKQEMVSEVVGFGPSNESVLDAPQEIDEYELVDPVDILKPLEKTGFWDGVKAAKWSERKEAVAELTKLASTTKIAPGDFTEICRTLKKLSLDVNIAVAVEAIQAIGNLARGLRNHFSGNSRLLLPILLDKLKEKKPTLTEVLTQTLQTMHKSGCLNLVDIVEDVKVATKNKVPLVRSLTLNWLTCCIESSNKPVVLKVHKEYVSICIECLNDVTPEVRDASFSALAAIAKLVGMRPLEKSLEKLDDVRRKKLSELIGGSEDGLVGTTLVQASSGSVSSLLASERLLAKRSAASMLSRKKPTQAAGAAAVPKKAVKLFESSSSLSGGGLENLPRADVSGKITPTLLKGFESPDRKVRLESIEAVQKILEEANLRIQPTGTVELFGALRGRLHDRNKNLVIATLSTVGALASAMGPAVEKSSKGILADVLKCLGDKHTKEKSLTTLDSWLAAVHIQKMVPYIAAALTDIKLGAEGRKDLFDWLSKQLGGLKDVTDTVDLLKPTASSITDKSPDVRKAAEVCIGQVVRVCGPETVTKNLKDIQGPALAIVREWLQQNGAFQETFEFSKAILSEPIFKSSSKVRKSASNGPGDCIPLHGSQAVSSRAISSKGSRTKSIMSVQDINIQSQPLLTVKDSNKEEREKLIVRRFKFEEPRLEQIHDLENDLKMYFRKDLSRRLLSADFKKQVDGIEMLHKALPSMVKEIFEVLDIVLRWCVLRFCESNKACLLKVLEFLPDLFDTLRCEGCTMTEAEAAVFLPCLIEKSGHNIEKAREKMRGLIKKIIHAYSAKKSLPYILEGLRSRNHRTRIECVDLVGFLFDTHGAEIVGQLKSLQTIASLTGERDGEIRKAALNTLAIGYKILGDDIWRYVGKLADAQRSILDDRFKWKDREMDKRKEGEPGKARAVLKSSVRVNGSDVAKQSGEVPRSVAGKIFSRGDGGHSEKHMEKHFIHRTTAVANGPRDWNEALDIIEYGSPEQSVEGMKLVFVELDQATNSRECSATRKIVEGADRLVSCLVNKLAEIFDSSLTGASSRSCKLVLNVVMQVFKSKRFAHAVKESTLESLITELLLRLLDERVPQMNDGCQLLKALNVLILKILENAEQTALFLVLINLLHPLDPSRWLSPTSNECIATRKEKFSDLVIKCLFRLTKVLRSTVCEVDIDCVLQSIHLYLQVLGMEEIQRRAGANDKPLTMVKIILQELVKLVGPAIKGHLSRVPIDMEPQPIIVAFIES